MSNVNERIKEIRKKEGLTQKEFCNRVLISQSYLSDVERGKEIPTDKLIKLISLEFNVSENWLRGKTDDTEELGEKIKLIRNNLGLTQKQFGDIFGLSASHISNIENNTEKPSDMFLKFISSKFQINYELLKNDNLQGLSMQLGMINFNLKDLKNPLTKKYDDNIEQQAKVLSEEYDLNELATSVLKQFLTLDDDKRDIFIKFAHDIADTKNEPDDLETLLLKRIRMLNAFGQGIALGYIESLVLSGEFNIGTQPTFNIPSQQNDIDITNIQTDETN